MQGKVAQGNIVSVSGGAWTEKHYSPKELGAIWGLSNDSIIRIFTREPGVLKFCPPSRRGVRKKITYRIPESVMQRVYDRCMSK